MTARQSPPRHDAALMAAGVRRMRRLAAEAAAMPLGNTGIIGNDYRRRQCQARARELEQLLRAYADEILAGSTALESRLVLYFEGGPAWPIISCPRDVTPDERRAWRLSATGARREWDPSWPAGVRRS